jgi:hypothetical protein
MAEQQQPLEFGGVGPQPTSTEVEPPAEQNEEIKMELGGPS